MPRPPLLVLLLRPCLRALTEKECRRGLLLQSPANKLVVLTAEAAAPTPRAFSSAPPRPLPPSRRPPPASPELRPSSLYLFFRQLRSFLPTNLSISGFGGAAAAAARYKKPSGARKKTTCTAVWPPPRPRGWLCSLPATPHQPNFLRPRARAVSALCLENLGRQRHRSRHAEATRWPAMVPSRRRF